MLEKNRTLKELQLSNNALEDAGLEQLAKSLMHPDCTIQSLWLGDCEFSDACCTALASVLLANHTLKELDLSNNGLGDVGILRLVGSLKQPACTLEQLVLFDIYWTEQVDEELKELDLSNNGLGDVGILRLVGSLKQPACTLEQLVLFDIYWTEQVDEELNALKDTKPSLRIIC